MEEQLAKNGVLNLRAQPFDHFDKVSGKGTWERNPYVFTYTFELVK